MKQEITTSGGTYVVTFTQAGTVEADRNNRTYILATASEAGQVAFKAISDSVIISDDNAILTAEDFVFAPGPILKPTSGGGSTVDDWITINDAGEATLNFPEETNDLMENISLSFNKFTKITGNVGGKLHCMGFVSRSSTLTYLDIVANKAEISNICNSCSKLTYAKIVAEKATGLNSLFQGASIPEAYIYTPNAVAGLYIFPQGIKKVTLHWGKFKTIDFSSSSTTYIPNITDIIILSGGLASCTSFKIPNSTNLTDESIQNIINALPDYSGTETSALVSFPPGRLTTEQQEQLAAKNWTWS